MKYSEVIYMKMIGVTGAFYDRYERTVFDEFDKIRIETNEFDKIPIEIAKQLPLILYENNKKSCNKPGALGALDWNKHVPKDLHSEEWLQNVLLGGKTQNQIIAEGQDLRDKIEEMEKNSTFEEWIISQRNSGKKQEIKKPKIQKEKIKKSEIQKHETKKQKTFKLIV